MRSSDRYPFLLLSLFAVLWLLLAISPADRMAWLMDNILVFVAVPLLVFTYSFFRFSNASYTFIFFFLSLHLVAAHYTYGLVPIDWSMLGSERNQYDRVVHFLNGLLLVYPVREIVMRAGKLSGFWSYYIPLTTLLAFSALYEILEWLMAVLFHSESVEAFLGIQGDIFDAVKDLALAGVGSSITMVMTFIINLRLNQKKREKLSRLKEQDGHKKKGSPLR